MKKIKDRFTVILWDVYHKSERLNSASTSTQNGSKCSLFSRLEASILFTNELYSYTKDEQLLNSIHEKTQLLNSQFAGIRTNNYSLFSGKLGAGYVNMEVFITTGDRQYLLHAIKYATEYCESDAYRYDIIIKSGLGDGLAGILFFFHKLFLCSREEWIGQKAEEMIYKIVNNAYSGTAGFFWGGVTNEKGKNCGYIQGTSGVALTLYKIARVHKIPVLQAFSEEAFLYEKNNIIAAKQKEENDLLMTDISLGTGTIGTLLADLLIGEHGFLQKPSSLERVAGYLNIITEKMREERQFNLLTGIAGIGVLFTEAYKLSYGEIYL
ncbi:MAG: hypothetical protein NTW29_19430 [Bacteroidetes bacterium]|nr:hypothetical protein [Bacteroidota bacterium]